MNLPPKLLARLKKRGISLENRKPDKEEIFAENYDDETNNNNSKTNGNKDTKSAPITAESDRKYIVYEVANCPNLSNPYHKCVEYCLEKYENKKFQPDSQMIKKRDRMLRRYPLPPNWIEVADPSTNRFYYWNTKKDEVSWLSPGHPRAVVRAPRDKGRAGARPGDSRAHKRPERGERDRERDRRRRRHSSSESRSSGSSNRSRSNDSGDERRSSRHRSSSSRKDKSSSDRRKEEKKRPESDPTLDPMDPAAYSDVPRGSWKTGLDVRGSAKTGVDVTASGPLFQQRPYPSPGDILRQNAMLDSKKSIGGGSDNERENDVE